MLNALIVTGLALLKVHSPSPLQAEATNNALRPWETPIEGFFVRSHFDVPRVDAENWTLTIDGLVTTPLTITMKDLKALETSTFHAVLECSGNGRGQQEPRAAGVQWQRGAVGNAEWSGAAIRSLLEKAGVKPEAKFATLTGADKPNLPSVPGFIRSVPLEKIMDPGSIVAWSMNRQDLPLLHGGPLRVVLPNWYGENWIKWVTKITLTAEEDQGFYMKKGYRMPRTPVKPGEAWDAASGVPVEQILVQSFIVEPQSGDTLKMGVHEVRGKAFSGAGAITEVEYSIDNAKTWQAAQVQVPLPRGGWQEFKAAINFNRVGTWDIQVRATDALGNVQPLGHTWNPPGYLRNAIESISVNVGAQVPVNVAAAKEHPKLGPIATSKCVMCHAAELIEGQRLSVKQWEATVKKMEGFGVVLTAEERSALIAELLPFNPTVPMQVPRPITYQEANDVFRRDHKLPPLGVASHGEKTYQSICVGCHGKEGEGQIGPRLVGRMIPPQRFWDAVLKGKGQMPPFAKILQTKDIADVEAYLVKTKG